MNPFTSKRVKLFLFLGLAIFPAQALFPSLAVSRDVFLTIGGGYSPTGNQISLEKNVQLFSSYLVESYAQPPEHYIFFSDGDGQMRDLQYIPTDFPRVNEVLAQINNRTSGLKYRYRNHEVPNVRGGANKSQIQNWFQKEGSGLAVGDRLIVYVTAHGGKSNDKEKPENSRLHLWNGQSIDVNEFRGWLELIDPEVPIIVVMVQCYSGGFANMILDPEKSGKASLERPWCGFYATIPTRVAAGCTPDTREENYHEYTTYMMEALRGKTRLGQTVERPDFNGDGAVSLDEAHSFALIQSRTIDISMKTSDQYLRKIEISLPEEGALDKDSDIDMLVEAASVNQSQIINALSEQLELQEAQRATAATKLAERLSSEKKEAEQKRRQLIKDLQQNARSIRSGITFRWPELNNSWNPECHRLLEEQGDRILRTIEGHPRFGKFMELRQRMTEIAEEAMDADRKWVKCQRLIRTLDSVARASNLRKYGSTEEVDRYEALVRLESSLLGNSAEPTIDSAEGQP
ncbi:MAG: hypothetical protein VXZ63_08585 [Planctomycetota bacterium]|nr:hypothetical protein [Planctomycetota bacterium]